MYCIVGLQGIVSAAALVRCCSFAAVRRFIDAFGGLRLAAFFLLSAALSFPIVDFLRLEELNKFSVQIAAGRCVGSDQFRELDGTCSACAQGGDNSGRQGVALGLCWAVFGTIDDNGLACVRADTACS